jgi:hypothetical protein
MPERPIRWDELWPNDPSIEGVLDSKLPSAIPPTVYARTGNIATAILLAAAFLFCFGTFETADRHWICLCIEVDRKWPIRVQTMRLTLGQRLGRGDTIAEFLEIESKAALLTVSPEKRARDDPPLRARNLAQHRP